MPITSFGLSPSLSLSLSHTHILRASPTGTHTHTHTQSSLSLTHSLHRSASLTHTDSLKTHTDSQNTHTDSHTQTHKTWDAPASARYYDTRPADDRLGAARVTKTRATH